MSKNNLIQLKNIFKSYRNTEGQERQVLDNINFSLPEKEFISVVGKSGSGKSTFLRIIAGLIQPSQGEVYFQNKLVHGPVTSISMVFQNFALLPWLSVLENVELGLEAQGVPRKLRRQRALKTIDTIGLDGYESAYPKELSGGMRQRVGFARAMVLSPELLLMDEPFSALDILTAENLRNDLLDVWSSKNAPIKGVICVTHDIEEAIILSNRIVIFASDPGRIQAEIKIDLPYPRDTQSPKFKALLEQVYDHLTNNERRDNQNKAKNKVLAHQSATQPEFAYLLPDVGVSELTGLLEAMESHEKNDRIDIPLLVDSLHLDVNNLFPLTETLDMLRFAKIVEGDLMFTEAGKAFVNADILKRKQLFAKHLLKYVPLARHIRDVLDEKPNHRVLEDFFLQELKEHLREEEAEQVLKVIINWGRYAEVLAYDYDAGYLSLENPQ